MIQKPWDVLEQYPIRKNKKQKAAFLGDVTQYLQSVGYNPIVEQEGFSSRNLVIGNPDTAKYLITAHYDTCATLPFPNLITPCSLFLYLLYQVIIAVAIILPAVILTGILIHITGNWEYSFVANILMLVDIALIMIGPANITNANDNTSGVITVLEIAASLQTMHRNRVCFVLFDNEELGLLGSAAYSKRHKAAVKNQIVLNLDCIGDGNEIMIFPGKRIRRDSKICKYLSSVAGQYGPKKIVFYTDFSIYPSDQANFPLGVGICAMNRGKCGLYLSRIHTRRDTILDKTNVNLLRASLCSIISMDAVQ